LLRPTPHPYSYITVYTQLKILIETSCEIHEICNIHITFCGQSFSDGSLSLSLSLSLTYRTINPIIPELSITLQHCWSFSWTETWRSLSSTAECRCEDSTDQQGPRWLLYGKLIYFYKFVTVFRCLCCRNNKGRFFNGISEHGGFIAFKACICQYIPWQLSCSGTWYRTYVHFLSKQATNSCCQFLTSSWFILSHFLPHFVIILVEKCLKRNLRLKQLFLLQDVRLHGINLLSDLRELHSARCRFWTPCRHFARVQSTLSRGEGAAVRNRWQDVMNELRLGLKIRVFWDLPLPCWVNNSWCFEERQCLQLWGRATQEEYPCANRPTEQVPES